MSEHGLLCQLPTVKAQRDLPLIPHRTPALLGTCSLLPPAADYVHHQPSYSTMMNHVGLLRNLHSAQLAASTAQRCKSNMGNRDSHRNTHRSPYHPACMPETQQQHLGEPLSKGGCQDRRGSCCQDSLIPSVTQMHTQDTLCLETNKIQKYGMQN